MCFVKYDINNVEIIKPRTLKTSEEFNSYSVMDLLGKIKRIMDVVHPICPSQLMNVSTCTNLQTNKHNTDPLFNGEINSGYQC